MSADFFRRVLTLEFQLPDSSNRVTLVVGMLINGELKSENESSISIGKNEEWRDGREGGIISRTN